MDFLSKNTDWAFKKDKWTFDDFRLYEFTKKLEKPGVRNFNEAIRNNFLSLAITANDSMEYTLESPDKLP